MEKAKKNEFSTMTLEQARKLPFDGKKDPDTKEFTSVSMKRGLVKDDGKEYIERRIFRNSDMEDVIVYDLPLPLTLDIAKAMYGESDCLDAIWTAKRIKTDAEKAGKGSKPKDPDKLASDLLGALGLKGVDKAKIDAIQKALKQAGFGK